jgi:dTDP-4-dehydrorhamnose reductase
LAVVDDQQCTPTSTADFADALIAIVRTDEYGLYHATNTGSTTWCGFARAIFELSGIQVTVTPITSAEFAAAARRPSFSVLDCTRLANVTGLTLRPWREALADYLQTADNDPA